jgi:hypothetical protein
MGRERRAADLTPSRIRANDPATVLARLREPDAETVEICLLHLDGTDIVRRISKQTVARLAREAVDIITRHRK